MEIKNSTNPSDFEVGVMIARFQVHKLHEGHIALIDSICNNHKKVIIFLGIPQVQNTDHNPLDFATRKAMVQKLYPNVIILPIKDNRSNEAWSHELDSMIKVPFGEKRALLYGSRDSFLPFYSGKYQSVELITDIFYSGTEIRKQVSREILESEDFRAGVIHACTAQWPVAYPCVDVVAYNDKEQLLLAQKPNEEKWRFIGGHVDVSDESLEFAAKREFREESGNCEIDDLKYVGSIKVPDWRYAKERSGIVTSLFIGKFIYGAIKPSDDISALMWFNIDSLLDMDYEGLEMLIVPEHIVLMEKLIKYLKENKNVI
jgi:bifunctional NMN adenylyltransferase/nudix hydrolase